VIFSKKKLTVYFPLKELIIELVLASLDVVGRSGDHLIALLRLGLCIYEHLKVMRKGRYDFRVVFLDLVQRLDAFLEHRLLLQTSMIRFCTVCAAARTVYSISGL
jgi:hypothetical protein